jgi:hypothetical protein
MHPNFLGGINLYHLDELPRVFVGWRIEQDGNMRIGHSSSGDDVTFLCNREIRIGHRQIHNHIIARCGDVI